MLDIREVAIEKIRIKKRVRINLGDLTSMIDSLRNYGQLNPIVINREYELIIGNRRLEAARQLGWATVQAIIIDRNSELEKLELEMEENIQRRELSPVEIHRGFDKLDRLRNPGFLKRIWNRILKSFSRGKIK